MNNTAVNIKKERDFKTTLMNKEEVFKLLSLAESLQLGVLLVGPPGTGKTKIVTDYTKGMFDLTNPAHIKHFNEEGVFMLETDESTKGSEIKGILNLEKLVTENKYEIDSHITKADTIIINEVDKASSSLRNSLLGIMNERILFNGKDKLKCNWKLFVATCNEIPKEEKDSPFWDRFAIKVQVGRLSAGDILKYYEKGDKSFTTKIKVKIPSASEISNILIPSEKLEKFINITYKKCSDRTLSFIPTIAKATSLIYNCSIDKALVKACELIVDKSSAEVLSKELLSPQKKAILDKVDILISLPSQDQIEKAVEEIELTISNLASTGQLNKADIDELNQVIEFTLSEHPYFHKENLAPLPSDEENIPF